MNIRGIITTGLAGYTLVVIIVAIRSQMGYATPFADYIVCVGGGIALVVAVLMMTTFREET